MVACICEIRTNCILGMAQTNPNLNVQQLGDKGEGAGGGHDGWSRARLNVVQKHDVCGLFKPGGARSMVSHWLQCGANVAP